MSSDFYSLELQIRERIGSKYQEAEAHRLANTVRRSIPIHHNMRKGADGALKQTIRAVGQAFRRRNQRSPVPR
jgi:hypothetical protein